VCLEQGPLSLVSTTEELLGRNSSGFGLEILEYGRGDPSCWSLGILYPQNLALTSQTSGGRSVDIVRSRNEAMEFRLFFYGKHVQKQKYIKVFVYGARKSEK
jgi:hypothetical protein